MNAAVQQMPVQPGTGPKLGEALVAGRIVGVRSISTQNGKLWLTLVKLPAPDEFTSPQTIELRSKDRPGSMGEDLRCKVRIGGFGRSYDKTDKDTGEQVTVRTAEVRLDIVAA